MNQISKPGLLKFSTMESGGRQIPRYGPVLRITAGHQMLVTQPPLLNTLSEGNSPWLRTTILTQNKTESKKSRSTPGHAITTQAKRSSANNTELRRLQKARPVKFLWKKLMSLIMQTSLQICSHHHLLCHHDGPKLPRHKQ